MVVVHLDAEIMQYVSPVMSSTACNCGQQSCDCHQSIGQLSESCQGMTVSQHNLRTNVTLQPADERASQGNVVDSAHTQHLLHEMKQVA